MVNHEILCVIVDFGKGSKVIKIAKKAGITGATILLGKGTVNTFLAKLLAIIDVRKEIVLMITDITQIKNAMELIKTKFKLDKPGHGIAFTMPILNFLGHPDSIYNKEAERRGVNSMYTAIFVVVDKGKGEAVVDSALLAGSKGATIINGRGSGIHEQKVLFSFPIEPEKEIVMIISKNDITHNIVTKIREDLNIDEPGMGILYTMPINETYGLI